MFFLPLVLSYDATKIIKIEMIVMRDLFDVMRG